MTARTNGIYVRLEQALGEPKIMILLCQGAGGLWTGLEGPHLIGGQALIRSHGPPRSGMGGVDTTANTYDSHGCPFRSKAKGVANHRDGGRDPTELEHQFNR